MTFPSYWALRPPADDPESESTTCTLLGFTEDPGPGVDDRGYYRGSVDPVAVVTAQVPAPDPQGVGQLPSAEVLGRELLWLAVHRAVQLRTP